MVAQANYAGAAGAVDKRLSKLGGWAAWIAALITLGEVVFFAFYPQPATVNDWFQLQRIMA